MSKISGITLKITLKKVEKLLTFAMKETPVPPPAIIMPKITIENNTNCTVNVYINK